MKNILINIAADVKETMITCIHSNNKITDINMYIVDNTTYDIKWEEDDCDLIGYVTHHITGEYIGLIRIYRFRMWIEYTDGDDVQIEEVYMQDPIVTII